jgi:beta-lactamase class A
MFLFKLLFRRKKKKEDEDEDDEDEDDELEDDDEEEDDEDDKKKKRRKIKDLNPQNRRKRVEPPKPWGKKERILVTAVLGGTVLLSFGLAAYARSWKLPGSQRIVLPEIANPFEQKIIIENPQPSPNDQKKIQDAMEKFKQESNKLSGVYGFYVIHLTDGVRYGVYEKEIFEAASLIKLPIIAGLYLNDAQGVTDIDTVYTLKNEDKVGGSGFIIGQPAGTKYTYRELAQAMAKQSDNTAFNAAKNFLGATRIHDVIDTIGMTKTNEENNETSLEDIGRFFEKLYQGKIVSKDSADEILNNLTKTAYEDYLPKVVDPGIRVAHKYGREVHVINDAGIIYTAKPFVFVMMTKGVVEKEAEENWVRLAKIIYEAETQ